MIRTHLAWRVSVAVALLAIPACFDSAEPASLPDPAAFRVGATREAIVESFGPPLRKQELSQTGQHMWGAIEDFWSKVALNSTVEIWAYRVDGGTVELYFIDASERVQGTGYAPLGVVYEAEP